MGVRKDWPILKNIIEKAINSISQEEKDRISQRWIRVEFETGVDIALVRRWSFGLGTGALFLFVFFFMWNRRLQKEISAKEAAEKALKENEEKLRNIVENSTNLFYAHTADHEIIYISPQCRRFLQCEPEEAMIRWTEFATDNTLNRKGFELTEKAILTGKRQPPYDLELVGKKGGKIIVEVREAPIVKDGKTVAIVGSLTDITERKQAEEALKEQTKTINDILDKAADGICVGHNISEEPFVRFTHWNPRMKEITGYTIEEINQLGWYQSMYPDPEIRQKAVERMSRMRLGDDIKAEEWIITTKDQEQKALSISTSVLKENQGSVSVLAIMQDVSERRKYEDQLIASRKEWEDIFQAIGQPTVILDLKHGILKANQEALALTDLTENQIRGKKCFDIFHVANRPPDSCPMEKLLSKGTSEAVEMEMDAFGGTFLVSCTPIFDNDGSIEKIIHIATDITRIKKLEAELRHSQKMEAIGTLAGGIAHEFNNMLGIIIGNAELAVGS